jgi:CheY-like chemotaxis protein
MNIEVYEISFPVDRPDSVGPRILEKLQQTLTQAKMRAGGQSLQASHHVLIVDARKERARYLGALLNVAGYQHMAASTTVEAFTLILQGMGMPFAIILGQDDTSQRFFLKRLFQRIKQQNDGDLLLMRLLVQPASGENLSSFEAPSTTPPVFPRVPGGESPLPTTPPPMTSLHGLSPFSSPFTSAASQSAGMQSLSGIASSVTSMPPSKPSTGPLSSGSLPPIQHMLLGTQRSTEVVYGEKVPLNMSLEGQDIGRYRITAQLGLPQSSNTYRAYDRLREKDMALKALRTDTTPFHLMEGTIDEAHLFQQEASLLEKLEHPHILRVLNAGRSYISGAPFIYKTMFFCAGGSLAQWLREHGAPRMFSLQEVLPLIWQLADGLQYLHDHGLIYQNFKFSNILIKNDAEDMSALQVALSDLSAVQDRAFISRSHDSYAYVAPERWQGVASPASDQYALAAITYELLAGRPPFHGSSEHTMRLLHSTMQPQPPGMYNPTLPPWINTMLLRALAKKAEERFASVGAFAQILHRYFL